MDVLPLVAGRAVQPDPQREALGLARVERAEVDRRQTSDRGERQVVVDASLELRGVRVLTRGNREVAGRRRADRGVGLDAARVLDVERLGQRLARLQVREVQVERTRGAVVVTERQRQRGGTDVDGAGVGRREVRPGAREQNSGDDAERTDRADDALDETAELGELELLRGHFVPLSAIETASS